MSRLTARHLGELVALEREVFGGCAYPGWFIGLMLSSGGFVVLGAWDGPLLVGYVAGERGAPCSRVVSIGVREGWRRRGVGTLLVKRVEEELGAGCVELEVKTSNKGAVRFYESLGYKRVGVLRDYYGRGSHAYLMRKTGRA